MEKRYQVFVSSTYEDLQQERKEVMQALLELDCIPAGMELFPASNDDQWSLIKRVIDGCDYYLLIIGGRYGSTNEKGISYTQMEFEYALQTGKPIITFIHKNPDSIPSGKVEKSEAGKEKLEQFKEIAQKKLVRYWETPADLGSVVSRSMVRLIQDYPAEGWIRANSAVDLEAAKEITRLQKENRALLEEIHKNENRNSEEIQAIAQGSDLYKVEFVCYYLRYAPNKKTSIEKLLGRRIISEYKHIYYELPWSYIFQKIGGILLDHCTERAINRRFVFLMTPQVYSILHKNDHEVFRVKKVKLGRGVLKEILIQFAALGLIKREKHWKRWKLTEYGKGEGMRLMAIKHQ